MIFLLKLLQMFALFSYTHAHMHTSTTVTSYFKIICTDNEVSSIFVSKSLQHLNNVYASKSPRDILHWAW